MVLHVPPELIDKAFEILPGVEIEIRIDSTLAPNEWRLETGPTEVFTKGEE